MPNLRINPTAREGEARCHRIIDYMQSSDFLCGPGRHSLASGTIECVPWNSEIVTEGFLSEGLGDLPSFRHGRILQKTLADQLAKIRDGTLEAVVFVASEDPPTHIGSFNIVWSFATEVTHAVAKLHVLTEHKIKIDKAYFPNRSAIRKELSRQVRHSPSRDVTLNLSDESQIFLTAMGPLFERYNDKPHGRYAPHFCIAIVDFRAVAKVARSPESFEAIKTDAIARSKIPYEGTAIYPIPNDESFAQHIYLCALGVYEGLLEDNRIADNISKDQFLTGYCIAATELGIHRILAWGEYPSFGMQQALYVTLYERGYLK